MKVPRQIKEPVQKGHSPDVAVGVNEHHDGADGAARLEEEDPAAVEEEEDSEAELHRVAHGLRETFRVHRSFKLSFQGC